MNTPIQELKEAFFANSRISNYQSPDGRQDEVIDLQVLTGLFDEALKKEKEFMERVWLHGVFNWDGDGTFEDFYNETFNNGE